MADFKGRKKGSPISKTWGFFFGGSGHGPESSRQISANYKFFSGFNVLCHISTRLEGLCPISHFIPEVNDFTKILALAPLLPVVGKLLSKSN